MPNPNSQYEQNSSDPPKIGKTIMSDLRNKDIHRSLIQEFKDLYQFYLDNESKKRFSFNLQRWSHRSPR